MDNIFWGDNISILFSKENYINFFPTKKMKPRQKLNSLSRFIIYISFVLALFCQKMIYIQVCIIILILIYVFYKTHIYIIPNGLNDYKYNIIDPYKNDIIDNNFINRQFYMINSDNGDNQNNFAKWLYTK